MVFQEAALRANVPVYINTYNLPTYTDRLVKSLLAAGFGKIIVIDQASDSPEMKALLTRLETLPGCRVKRRRSNRGPRYFFDSLQFLTAGRWYFYTDPDVELPTHLPADFVTKMMDVSERLCIGKVGCALDLDDTEEPIDAMIAVQEGEKTAMSVVDFELRYWRDEIEPSVYRADVDTTFALYNAKYFRLWNFFAAVRMAGDFSIKHRPWYVDKRMPVEEAAFYADRCRYSSWLGGDTTGKSLFRLTPATYLIRQVKTARWRWWQLKGAMEKVNRRTKVGTMDSEFSANAM